MKENRVDKGVAMIPIVSIIVPVFNSEKYIEKCLKSLLAQTYKDLEILVIDDGSKDNSSDVVRQLQLDDQRIKLICQENQGVSSARNKGIEMSKGQYIVFVDSDDYVESNYVETLLDLYEEERGDVAISNYVINHDVIDVQDQDVVEKFDSKTAIANKFDSCVCCKLISAELAKSNLFRKDLVIAEDLYFYYTIMQKSNKIVYINRVGYHYVQHEAGTINKLSESKIPSMSVFEEMLNDCNDKDIYEAIISKYISTCFHLLSLDNSGINCEDIKTLKSIVKKHRKTAILGKYITKKVRFACLISIFSFDLINKLLKIQRG